MSGFGVGGKYAPSNRHGEALKDNDESVRRHAAAALMKVDPAAAVSAGLR